jgi:hypothetical protein
MYAPVGIVHQQLHTFDDLTEVVRRDVRGHANGDAAGAIHQQVGNLGREHRGLLQPVVEVGLEIDGVLVDVLQHGHGNPGEPRFGVPIRGCGVAIDRTEISLPVYQWVPQGEFLDHSHQGVVNRSVSMRMVFAENVAYHSGRLLVRAAGHQAQLVHRIQDPPMDRLQTITHVRQGAGNDDAHRVVDERLLHFLFDEPGQNPFARVRCCHGVPVLGL